MNVVIVDDDVALLRSLELILAGRGHEVRTFHQPSRAVAHLSRYRDVDVLVLDCLMPGMNGEEVLARIERTLRPSTRIIAITGHTDVVDARRLHELGASEFLAKPLDLERLVSIAQAPEQGASRAGELGKRHSRSSPPSSRVAKNERRVR